MSEAFNDWAILELLGHRRLGGRVQEVEMFGGKMCRIDVPDANDPTKTHATQFYSTAAIYCLTPCSEDTARKVAAINQPAPVQRWELPAAPERTEDQNEDDEPEEY